MRVLTGLRPLATPPARTVVALGMFDGVHLGHQRLIRLAVRLAKQQRATSVAITFDPDPQQVLDPAAGASMLMSLDERIRHIRALGAGAVWVIPFSRAFSRTPPEAFVERMLVERMRAGAIVVGQSFRFGKDRRGDFRLLQSLARRYGMRVIALPAVRRAGAVVSSSRIREALRRGELAAARRLLGHPPTLTGTVVRGEGRATALGFPTANLRLARQLTPPPGVYSVRARLGARTCKGVMNLGRRPTFGRGPLTCEVHLLGFHGQLYGRALTVELIRLLRDEQRFSDPAALARQIARDVARVRAERA